MLKIKTSELEKIKSKITTEKGVINPKLLTRYYLDGVLIGVENKKNVGTLQNFQATKKQSMYQINISSYMKLMSVIGKIRQTYMTLLVEIANSSLKQYYYNVKDCYKNMLGVGKCVDNLIEMQGVNYDLCAGSLLLQK